MSDELYLYGKITIQVKRSQLKDWLDTYLSITFKYPVEVQDYWTSGNRCLYYIMKKEGGISIFTEDKSPHDLELSFFADKQTPEIETHVNTLIEAMQQEPWRITSVYVNLERIKELRMIKSDRFDLSKLIELCEELNKCSSSKCYLAVAMLLRAVLDHVSPVFGCKAFAEVANNYRSGGKSFKQSMTKLENSLRKIADAYLHTQIRKKESLPNETQVNFSNDLDVLLAEIARILK